MNGRIAERLRFEPDRTVTVLSGKVELGQGLNDALTLICSEELALEPNRIRVRCGDTGATPDDGLTAGSGSMERAGAAVRAAARAARLELILRASKRLGVSPGRLVAHAGTICRHPDDVGGERGPAHGKAPRTADRPHGGRGSTAPAAGATAAGGDIDYWELLDPKDAAAPPVRHGHADAAGATSAAAGGAAPAGSTAAELGRRQSHRSRPAAAGLPPAPGDRDDSSPMTDASPRSAPVDGARQVRDSSPPPSEPDAQHLATEAPNRPLAAQRSESWRRVDRVVRAGANFVHDLRLPDMVHGRVLRPPGYEYRLNAVAADAARAMDGVLAVVVDGSFVAVAAERAQQADAAHAVLAASARWQRQADAHPGERRAPAETTPTRQHGAQVPRLPAESGTPQRGSQAAAAATTLLRRRSPIPGSPSDGRAALREAPAEVTPGRQRGSPSPDPPAAGATARLDPPDSATPPAAQRGTQRGTGSGTGSGRSAPPARLGLPADGRAQLYQARAEPNAILRRGSPPHPPHPHTASVSATYSRPFLMHASLGPSAAAARLDGDGPLTIWSHTQGPYELRAALAEALGRAPETIRVIHADGAGCYGHNGADDVALDAALLALAVPQRPVLVTWSREDEHRWEPYGTAMIVTCSADLDAAGSVTRWRHEVRSHAHGTRPRGTPGHSTLLAAWHRATSLTPPAPRNGTDLTAGPQRNAEPLYDFPGLAITTHFVPEAPLRVSALRSLGAFANVFAIESFMDELAARCGADPLAYRLRHLRDERARRVLTAAVRAAPALPASATRSVHPPAPDPAADAPATGAAAAPACTGDERPLAPAAATATSTSAEPARAPARAAAGRPPGPPGQSPANATGAAVRGAAGNELFGRGMAVARYKNLQARVAVVCDVAVDPGSARIRLLHAAIAADAGRIIDRDGLANQLEGGFLQAASWTLKEAVRWDAGAVRSTDWDTYPVLRFSEVPPVTVRLVDRPDLPSVGAGEAAQGPTPAAIANAVYAAAGIRLRHTPFTPALVMAALGSAGSTATGAAHARQSPRSVSAPGGATGRG